MRHKIGLRTQQDLARLSVYPSPFAASRACGAALYESGSCSFLAPACGAYVHPSSPPQGRASALRSYRAPTRSHRSAEAAPRAVTRLLSCPAGHRFALVWSSVRCTLVVGLPCEFHKTSQAMKLTQHTDNSVSLEMTKEEFDRLRAIAHKFTVYCCDQTTGEREVAEIIITESIPWRR